MDPWVKEQKMREMKKAKERYDKVSSICDCVWVIPDKCPCGGLIMNGVSPEPKYKRDFDTLLGSRYFTCIKYEDDGLHFRQPWVFGVQEEVRLLKKKVESMADEMAKQKVETMADEEVRQLKKKVEFMADEMAKLKASLGFGPSAP